MSKKSKLVFAAVLCLAVVVVLAAFFNGSLANYTSPSTMTPTPTLMPTLSPTPTPTPSPAATPSPTPMPIPIDFTCVVGSHYSFVVWVNVDLNDGMDKEEAITVGEVILNHELTDAAFELKKAEAKDSGEWSVVFNWEYANIALENGTQVTPVLSHFFAVTINPQNRTTTYIRCM